ncbi:MAG TPA: poly(3-hydroxyalkanoate) depolymerase [Steroidobacteraceae bacterium]|nr:poly(3-hydroxyalkanoate) depolymerase [Steroidobacteraceae bacterium]
MTAASRAQIPTPAQIDYIDVDGVRLRYAVRAGAGGTPLLIFNGIGANLEVVLPFIDAIQGREILIFDMPGTGGSPHSWVPRRFGGIARLAACFLDRLGYLEVDVAGVSWGGALAQQFARQYPRRCRRLVLCATSAGAVMVPAKLSVLAKLITPRRYLSRDYMHRAAPEIYGGEIRDQPELIRAHSSRIVPPTTQGYLYQLLAGLGWTSLWWLHRLRQPTLILAGSDDRLVPPINARLLALLIPNNRLHIIPGGGHLFMLHRLDDVVPLICEFLDRPAVRPMRSP